MSVYSLSVFAFVVNEDLKHSSFVNSATNGSTQHTGYGISKVNGNTVNYYYTGDVITSLSSLYDYKSDDELLGNSPNSTANGYTDCYTQFNTAISNDGTATIVSPANDNITFIYNSHRRGLSELYVYLFDNNGHNNSWRGYPLSSQGNGVYKLTMPFSDIGFTPTSMIFNGVDISGSWQTDDLQGLTYSGNTSLTYSDYIKTSSSNNMTFKLSKNDARIVLLGGANKADQNLHLRAGTIKLNVYDDNNHSGQYTMSSNGLDWQVTFDASAYDSNFYVSFMSDAYYDGGGNARTGNVETDSYEVEKGYDYTFAGKFNIATGVSENIINHCKYDIPLYFGCFYRGDTAVSYTNINKPNYSSFWWQANMSQRSDSTASVSGLVDSELHNNQLTQSNNVLPYFNSSWVSEDNSRDGLMESYENIWFPYYKVKMTANELRGSTNETQGYAEFYQFNSKDTSVYFNGTNYVESNVQIHSQATTSSASGTVGFYPFNNTDNSTQLNLGFGARFDVSFRLSRDGKVETVDSNGEETGDKINAMFEFAGDDDVWIFLDNKLVLDLGGCHKDATGLIDFAEKKVYSNCSFSFDDDNDVLNRTTSSTEQSLETLLAGTDTFVDGDYNETTVHTLTIFYMERGMYESDLLMRFNFAVIPNENILKVVNLTKNNDDAFSDAVNQLLSKSLFVYELENSGTNALNITDSGISYPTYDKYEHNNIDLYSGVGVNDTSGVYLDTSYDLDGNGKTWDSDGAIMGAYLWGGSQPATTVLMQQVGEHLYRVDVGDNTNIHFMRIAHGCSETFPYVGYLSNGNSGYWNRYKTGSFTAGYTYSINGWNDGTLSSTTYRTLYPAQSYNFDPDSGDDVANVSYKWVDSESVMSENIADDRTGLTGKTDSGGRFGLFAGSSRSESSAEFVGQFEKGSTIRFMQTNLVEGDTDYDSCDLSDSNVKVMDIFDSVEFIVKDNRGRTIPTQVINNGKDRGISFVFDNAVSVNDESVSLTIYIINNLDYDDISVSKVTQGYTGNADCTFNIQLHNLFNTTSYDNYIDYTKLSVTGNVSGNISVNSSGNFTMKANETATISDIPTSCEYKVTEVSCTDNNLHLVSSNCSSWTGLSTNGVINNGYNLWSSSISKTVSENYSMHSSDSFNVNIEILSSDYDISALVVPGTVSSRATHRVVTSTSIMHGGTITINNLTPDAVVNVMEEDLSTDADFVTASSTTSLTLNKLSPNGVLTNAYNHATHSLSVNKTLDGDYADYGVLPTTDFNVNIVIDGTADNKDLSGVLVSGNYSYTRNEASYKEISAVITGNTTINITNIPTGVLYSVTESNASRANTNLALSTYTDSGVLNADTNVTLNNHYNTVNKLNISKILSGSPSDYGVYNNTNFKVRIQLTGGDFTNTVLGSGVTYDSCSISASAVDITANLSVANGVLLKFLPNSYSYTISEITDESTGVISYINTGTYVRGNQYSGSYTGSNLQLTFKNDYPTLSNRYAQITIHKNISGDYSSHGVDNNTVFNLNIELTYNGSLPVANIFDNINCNHSYTVSDISEGGIKKIRITTGITSGGTDVIISGVPFNTLMNLSETGIDSSDLSANSCTSASGTIYNDSSFVLLNDYVSSTFVPYVLPAAGMSDMWGILYGTAFLLFGCTIAYCYSSYKRRKDDL